MRAAAAFALALLGPPALPDVGSDAVAPPAERGEDGAEGDDADAPEESEGGEPDDPAAEEPQSEDSAGEAEEPAPEVGDEPAQDEGGTAPPSGGAAPGPGSVAKPAIQSPRVQSPTAKPPGPAPAASATDAADPTVPSPRDEPSGAREPEGPASPTPAEEDPEPATRDGREPRRMGGFRFLRFGLAAKLGVTSGTSERNGIFDRDKSLQQSQEAGQVVVAAGDDESVRFGGGMGGFEADLEFFGINLLFDFHKFFRPGGMWSALLGYDHEFGLGKKKERLRLDVGAHVGMMRVFLGKALADLYYDPNNPEAVNIATAGLEVRLMTALQIRIIGPLFTGPTLMGGWHYLWTANAARATEEKGLHFHAGWTLRLDFAVPRNRPSR